MIRKKLIELLIQGINNDFRHFNNRKGHNCWVCSNSGSNFTNDAKKNDGCDA